MLYVTLHFTSSMFESARKADITLSFVPAGGERTVLLSLLDQADGRAVACIPESMWERVTSWCDALGKLPRVRHISLDEGDVVFQLMFARYVRARIWHVRRVYGD